jgi:hypothetical protein
MSLQLTTLMGPLATTIHTSCKSSLSFPFLYKSDQHMYSSQVYSSDIFHAAFKKDPRNKAVGKRYRKLILQPGGTRDPMDMIRDFLGRDPEKTAFYHDIGLAKIDT